MRKNEIHTVYARLSNGELVRKEIAATTRQDAKYKLYNLLQKWAAIAPKYVGAIVPKFDIVKYACPKF